MLRLFMIVVGILLCTPAAAVTREEVAAGAEHLYRERLLEAQQKYALDADPVFLERVRRITGILITQARRENPLAANLNWEIHTTGAPDESASCMAGGKLLIGQAYVARLELNDAELAMLISHELQHALLEHNFKEFREALRLEPEREKRSFSALEDAIDHDAGLMAKLDAFDSAQESEADREGLLLAWHAGWPAVRLANYFKKMAHADPMANFDSAEHPAAARRWLAMRELVEEIKREEGAILPEK